MRDELEIEEIDNLYNIIVGKENYVNPIVDGELSWRSICSYDIDLDEALDRWQIGYTKYILGVAHV